MGIVKICDECKEIIKNKTNDNLGFSEWAVWHWRKERNFCCDQCFLRFVLKKLIIDKSEDEKTKRYDDGTKRPL